MSLFADYSPRAPGESRAAMPRRLEIRPATTGDLEAIASLSAAREGKPLDTQRELFVRTLALVEAGTSVLIVAELDGVLIGYAKAGVWEAPQDGASPPPRGWYLGGVVVAPAHRRRGVGEALTAARLTALAERTDVVRYIASAENRASIDLHAQLGFEEERRGIDGQGLSFSGGVGLLFRKRLDAPGPPPATSEA